MRVSVAVVLCALLGACGSDPARPPTNSISCVTTCDASYARGGGGLPTGPGDSDAATSAEAGIDAAAPDVAPTSVSGTLRLFNNLPPGTTTTVGTGGWTVRTLPLLAAAGGDAAVGDVPDLDAATMELSTTTTATGDFTLPGVPARGALPGESATGYWLEATFPAMPRFGTLFVVREGTTPALQTFTDDTLRGVLSSVGFTLSDTSAVVAVYVRQSTVADAMPVSGVLVTAEGQVSGTLYDGPTGAMEISTTGTGSRGFALLANVPVPSSGDGVVTVTATRASRTWPVRVRRGTVSWLLVVAN